MSGAITQGGGMSAADLAALKAPGPAAQAAPAAPPAGGGHAHYANVGQVESPSPGVFSFASSPNRSFVVDSHGPQIETLGADGSRVRQPATAGEVHAMRGILIDQMRTHPTPQGALMLAALPPVMPSSSPFPVTNPLFR